MAGSKTALITYVPSTGNPGAVAQESTVNTVYDVPCPICVTNGDSLEVEYTGSAPASTGCMVWVSVIEY